MLVRMKSVNEILSYLVLLAFSVSLVACPVPLYAQANRAGDDEAERYVVLFVPVQHSEHVSESVPPRVQEYFRALVEIDPKISLVMEVSERMPEPEVRPAELVPESVRINPNLEKARNLADKGQAAVEKNRYESGLGRLMRAEKLFSRNLKDLEDFDLYVDTRLWLAVGFIGGGYNEEGRTALRALLVMRPELSMPEKTFSRKFMKNLASQKARINTGGDLLVTVDDELALVYVDGRLVGKGTQTVSGLAQGKHFVRVVAEGLPPAGKFVRTKSAGRSVSVLLRLTSKKAAAPEPVKAEAPTIPLTEYAKTGDFTGSFPRDARITLKKMNAEFGVLSYLARSDSAFHLGLFLFKGKAGEMVAIEPAVIDSDLSNLQIALLDLESRLAKALSAFPSGQRITRRPALYALAPSIQPEPAVVAAAPAESEPGPAYEPTPAATEEPPAATGDFDDIPSEAVATGGFDDIPEDFPMEAWPTESPSRPLYKEWWLWTVVGAVVTGTVVGVVCGTGKCGGGNGGDEAFGAHAVW